MKKQKIVLTDHPEDTAPEATSRVSPCRIDGPFEDGRTCGGKGPGGKGIGGKGGGAKSIGGKGGGAKSVGAKG